MISQCPRELAPVAGLDDPTVASWQVGDDADRTRLDFSQVAERPHLETATGSNGSIATIRFAWPRPLERLFMLAGVADP